MTLAIGLAAMSLAMAGIVGFLHAVWLYEMREELHDTLAEVYDYDSGAHLDSMQDAVTGNSYPVDTRAKRGANPRRSTTLT